MEPREGAIDRGERDALWPMVRRAAAFLARHGPVSPRETADAWSASIDRWLYVIGTTLAQQHGVDGYYVRVSELDRAAGPVD